MRLRQGQGRKGTREDKRWQVARGLRWQQWDLAGRGRSGGNSTAAGRPVQPGEERQAGWVGGCQYLRGVGG